MNSARITALLSGLGLLATWMASAPPSAIGPVPVRTRASDAQAPREDSRLPILHVNTDRLHGGSRGTGAYQVPRRNPFLFTARAQPPATAARPAPIASVAAPLPELPAPPPFILSGVAEDAGPAGPTRTAVLSTGRELYLVHEGEVVDGRYKVGRIGAEVVELAPITGGEPVVLRMK